MGKIVPPIGPRDAPIAIIGEAPGADEDLTGIPFVGRSGNLLNRLLKGAGIDREDCYITNVVKQRPPNNEIARLSEIGLDMDTCITQLGEELRSNSHNVVVALGNIPLNALCGLDKITFRRGSILRSTLVDGLKVIPTIHPAALLHSYSSSAYVSADLRRVKRESEFPDFRSIPDREYITNPSFDIVIRELEAIYEDKGCIVSIDLETDMGASYIKCLGITNSINRGLCIPFVHNRRIIWSSIEEVEIWKLIRKILISPDHYKIAQNSLFEYAVLYPWVGEITPMYMDTMVAQKTAYPELKKGLATICSLYTNEPFYKDDAKDGGWDGETLWQYNIKDICVTLEACLALDRELKHYGMYEFFHGYLMPLQRLFFQATTRGVRIDMERLEWYYNRVISKLEVKQKALDTIVGKYLNVNSPTQVRNYLYKTLGLSPIKLKKGIGVADEEALTRLMVKNPQHVGVLTLILEIRQMSKLLSTYLGGDAQWENATAKKFKLPKIWSFKPYQMVSEDGRMRTNLIVGGTETGRLASRKYIGNKGANVQNQPKYIRDSWISDPGYSFLVGDLSQVEARLVTYLSNDRGLKSIFEKGGDIHKEVASWVVKVPIHQVTPEQRQICKHTVHGANYDIGPRQFVYKVNEPYQDGAWLCDHPDDTSIGPMSLLKHGTTKEADGKHLIMQFHNAFPGVRRLHGEIRAQLAKDRTLISPYGRRRQFYGWWGDAMFREAYANIPQGMAGDIINKAAIRIQQRIQGMGEIKLQIHDELVIQVEDDCIDKVATIFKEEVERSITIGENSFVVPVEICVGKNWKDTSKWKEPNNNASKL